MPVTGETGPYVPGRGVTQPPDNTNGATPGSAKDPSLSALLKKNPAKPEPTTDNLMVCISRIEGLTDPSVLKKPFWFQCPPLDTMPQDYGWNFNDFQDVSSNMHTNASAPQLATFTMSSLFIDTDQDYWWTIGAPDDVLGMVAALKDLGDTMTPFLLQWGTPRLWGLWDVVMAVTLRSFHVEERGGENDARYFTMSFTEYADAPTTRAIAPPVDGSGHKVGVRTASNGTRVLATLNSADLPAKYSTLSKISKAFYGRTTGWTVIAKASGLTNVTANQDLKSTVGRRKPAPKIVVPVAFETGYGGRH